MKKKRGAVEQLAMGGKWYALNACVLQKHVHDNGVRGWGVGPLK